MVETIFTGMVFLISVLYLLMSRSLAVGTMASPGSGFLPLIAGSGATIISFILLVARLRENLKNKSISGININWGKVTAFLAGLIIYVAILKLVGYVVATFLVMLYLLKVCGTKGWLLPVGIATGISLGVYYVFAVLLGVTLP